MTSTVRNLSLNAHNSLPWHRALSSASSSSSSSSQPFIARLPHRSVLEVSGPDAQKFLKGLTCKDVDSLGGGYSGFLNASGRILHTVFVFPRRDTKVPTYLISHESSLAHPTPLAELLPPFRLRSKVRIRDVTEDWELYSAWGEEVDTGPKRSWKFGSGGAAEAVWTWESGVRDAGLRDGEVGCWDLRAGFGGKSMGRQLLVPRGDKPSAFASHEEATLDDYNSHRMLLGVPEGMQEVIPGQALPLESCMDIHGGVDFRKGCYLGQELTVRTYHTGATRKRILPIRLFPLTAAGLARPISSLYATLDLSETDMQTPTSDIVYHPPPSAVSQKSRSAGRVLDMHNTATSIGLGLVRLEMAEKSWWGCNMSEEILRAASIGDWVNGGQGRLTTEISGTDWGVFVGKGEAFAAAQAQIDSSKDMT